VNKTWHHACVQVSESVWQALKEIADRKGATDKRDVKGRR